MFENEIVQNFTSRWKKKCVYNCQPSLFFHVKTYEIYLVKVFTIDLLLKVLLIYFSLKNA